MLSLYAGEVYQSEAFREAEPTGEAEQTGTSVGMC